MWSTKIQISVKFSKPLKMYCYPYSESDENVIGNIRETAFYDEVDKLHNK